MIHPLTKMIILAESTKGNRPYGAVVSCEDKSFMIGHIDDWAEEFVDFEGSVTLSND